MALICELNQSVVHIYGGTVGVAIQWGDISGIRVKIQIFQLLRLILGGRYFATLDFPQC